MRGPTLPRPARTAFRRAATLAGLAALTVGLLALGATPARAGGPTSVLVVNYDGSRAAAALTGSRAYDDLAKALDVFSAEPPRGETAAPTTFMGTELRLTWLVHDVNPWRLDALRLDGAHIWVNTVTSWEGDLFDQPGVWHRPADEALLRATLTSMGILGPLASGSDAPASPGPAAATAPSSGTAQPVPRQAVTEGSVPAAGETTQPGWALATTGLVGLLLGWSGHRLVRGRVARAQDARSGDPGPHAVAEDPTDPGEPSAVPGPAAYDSRDPVTRFTLR